MRLLQLKSRLRKTMTGVRRATEGVEIPHDDVEYFGVTLRFSAGERIFAEGFHADRVYRIVSGFARLCIQNPGSEAIADFMLPGNWLGVFDRVEYCFSAEAGSNVVLRCYLKRDAERFFSTPRGGAIKAEAKRQFANAVTYRTALPGQSPEQRVTTFLRRFRERQQIEPDHPLALPFSMNDIGRHLGLTEEAVCRELAALNRASVANTSPEATRLAVSMPEFPAGARDHAAQQDRAVQFTAPETGAGLDRNQSPALVWANFAQAAARCS